MAPHVRAEVFPTCCCSDSLFEHSEALQQFRILLTPHPRSQYWNTICTVPTGFEHNILKTTRIHRTKILARHLQSSLQGLVVWLNEHSACAFRAAISDQDGQLGC